MTYGQKRLIMDNRKMSSNRLQKTIGQRHDTESPWWTFLVQIILVLSTMISSNNKVLIEGTGWIFFPSTWKRIKKEKRLSLLSVRQLISNIIIIFSMVQIIHKLEDAPIVFVRTSEPTQTKAIVIDIRFCSNQINQPA